MIVERILGLFGIYKCHWCKKYIFPSQKFVGHINMKLIPDGKSHNIYANWITHDGGCTQRDIEYYGKYGYEE